MSAPDAAQNAETSDARRWHRIRNSTAYWEEVGLAIQAQQEAMMARSTKSKHYLAGYIDGLDFVLRLLGFDGAGECG